MEFIFKAMFFIIPIFSLIIFIVTIAVIISPKLRGKFMSNQVKATKYMLDDVKDDLTDIGTTVGDVSVNTYKNVIDNNEDNLRETFTKQANISKDAIETTVRSIKNSITKDDVIYCKHCGKSIDSDSQFCKFCGKRQ